MLRLSAGGFATLPGCPREDLLYVSPHERRFLVYHAEKRLKNCFILDGYHEAFSERVVERVLDGRELTADGISTDASSELVHRINRLL